jgi:hypothetical protein
MLKHKREGAEHARQDRETQLASARETGGEQPPPPSPGGFGYRYRDGYSEPRGGGDGCRDGDGYNGSSYDGRSTAAKAVAATRTAGARASVAATSREIRDAGGVAHIAAAEVGMSPRP